jgi:integral membrane protein
MFKTAIGRLRVIGLIEGVSFLILLGIAMPLKYLAGQPEAVRIVGMLHGVFFVFYVLAVAHVKIAHRWSVFKALTALVASVIPFGNFILDARVLKHEQ